jgi:ribose 5-phosphate isomerase A
MGPVRSTAQSQLADSERFKRAAAKAAAELVRDGMRVGLGTGSTVACLLPALARRGLDVRCVATSHATEQSARELGLALFELDELGMLDIAIDGADQIAPDGWVIKGGGGAHTREKIVARSSERFVVIASPEKLRDALQPPVPLEVLRFGAHSTLAAIGDAALRDVPPSPDGNLIADYLGPVEDPGGLAARLSSTPGVVEHGLFEPELVSDIVIAGPGGIEHRRIA